MGLRDRFKKRVARAIGRDTKPVEPPPKAAERPPPPAKRPRASYRTHQAEAVAPAPEPTPPVEAQAVEVQAPPKPEAEISAPAPAPPVSDSPPAPAPSLAPDDEVMAKRPIDEARTYTVRLFNKEEGLDTEIEVFDGEFVLDAADRCAVDLPSSCRNGGCTVCAGRLITGTMEMEDQYVLEEEHIEEGFQLLCCAVVTSDAVIETHQDEVVA